MLSISEWWNETRLNDKLKESQEARSRYLMIMNEQSKIAKCTPRCATLCEEKRKARIDYLAARIAYLEALVERRHYT